MDSRFRIPFNQQITNERYDAYQRELSSRLGCEFSFRLAESPLFIPDDFKAKLVTSANEILDQLMDQERLVKMKRAVPPRWDTPGLNGLPNFTQIDFAVVRAADGTLEPKLIELQGFPSLTAMQIVQRDVWTETLEFMQGLDLDWSCWYSGYDRDGFVELARRTIVGRHDPANVILMDIEPLQQKTYPDFAATRLLFGVDAVDPRSLEKRGDQLWRRDAAGRELRVSRIYNRVVFDELMSRNIELPFDYREPLDVEWAPHPNWYWIWSKYSLPFIDHPAVPRARFVSEVDLDALPEDLAAQYVLKPLFSFAGGGVNVEPTRDDVLAIPESERGNWCLQEKIEYEPAMQAADGGGVKIEIRMMFLRPDDEPRPILAQNLVRLSRGKMLGVDFNKSFSWVGSSIGLSPTS